ncbi:MAG TPA: HYR domain-containing protein, partial [candidate division Zixibacteria bacterium]|nr:HYR domain-containing protein [candidate division Zixibacteria bacterium]
VGCSPSSGSAFPLGVSNVACMATDGSGNQDSCTFTVTVWKGDADGNGDLTPADAIALLNCIFLGIGSCDICFVDLNCDGQITPTDAIMALNAVFLGIINPCTL